jgi:hypothetical protein
MSFTYIQIVFLPHSRYCSDLNILWYTDVDGYVLNQGFPILNHSQISHLLCLSLDWVAINTTISLVSSRAHAHELWWPHATTCTSFTYILYLNIHVFAHSHIYKV